MKKHLLPWLVYASLCVTECMCWLFLCPLSHQTLLGVQVACLVKDQCLSQLAVTRAIGRLTEILTTGGRDCEVEEDRLVEWTSKLLKVTLVVYLLCTQAMSFTLHINRTDRI